ncbi:MAG: hypothetical protein P4L16_06325 [Chlamydiales bacterium]|nr:hypothetical protein [Chlamydiales bacterium]
MFLTNIFAGSNEGIRLERQSLQVTEIESGGVATASFLITNDSQKKVCLKGGIEAPTDWTVIPEEFAPIVLEPGESFLQLVAVKAPKSACSEIYDLYYFLKEDEGHNFIEKSLFQIIIGATTEIEACVEDVPKHGFLGESYIITLYLKNRGNISADLCITAKEHFHFPLYISPTPRITLHPGEARCVKVLVNTDRNVKCHIAHTVTLHVLDICSKEVVFAHTTLVDMFPLGYSKNDIYNYYPSSVELGAGFYGGKKQVYVGSQGCGYLDENKDRHIDYYFRAPFIQQVDVAYDLTCVQEDAYFRYCDHAQNIYLGNGIYTMTPLTMSFRYGWGAGYAGYFGPVEVGTMYVKDSSYFAEKNGAFYAAYKPAKWCRFSLSELKTDQGEQAAFQLDQPRSAHTYSARSQLFFCKQAQIDTECAVSKGTSSYEKTRYATYVYVKGEPLKSCWYTFQNIYAPPRFVGFYSDTRQTNASIGFPIYKRVQASISQNYYSYNLDRDPNKERATRDKNRWVTLSSPLPYDIYASLSYNNAVVKDPLKDISYTTNYLSLVFNKTICEWMLQGVCEQGKHINRRVFNKDHHWQNYQLYIHYRPSSYEMYAIYSRQGYQMIVDCVKWAQVYGVNLVLCGYKNWFYNLFYEHTWRTKDFKRNFASGEVKYVFPNEHALKLKGFWNREDFTRYFHSSFGHVAFPTKQSTEVEMLLTYTVPLNIPIGRKKSGGTVQGIVSAGSFPIARKSVMCNQERSLTDSRGTFCFSHLGAGYYYLNLEAQLDGFVSLQPLPMVIAVQEGRVTNCNIQMVKEAEISGRVCYIDRESGALKGVHRAFIVLRSIRIKEKMQMVTNEQGLFVFKHLRPGQWEVIIHSCELPEGVSLKARECIIDIRPGEKKSCSFEAIQKSRKIQFIDEGALSYNLRAIQ